MENNVTLPDEIVEEILLKLRVKCLLRFKCVCKSWLSLISDPRFAKLHYDLGAGSTHQLLLRNFWPWQTNSIDIEASLHDDSAKVVVKIPYPSTYHIDGIINFVGSCRGFLLLTTVCPQGVIHFVIWNPSTGLRKRFNKVLSVLSCLYGIGYDASTDDYVIVMISLGKEVNCFSVRSNSWSYIEAAPLPFKFIVNKFLNGSYLNGTLHWLVSSYDDRFKIIAFDLVQKRLSEIPLPHDFREHTCCLNVMGGCLCLFSTTSRPAQMWIMKEYKVQSSWISTSVPDAPYGFRPICFTKNGEILGYNNRDKMLMRLTDKGKLLEKHISCSRNKFLMYEESLLSLPPN